MVKITQQFRERQGMAYDFLCEDKRLTVRMVPETESDPVTWRVELRMSDAADAVSAHGVGQTRTIAFSEAARAWDEQSLARDVPRFDWEGITRALSEVRAL